MDLTLSATLIAATLTTGLVAGLFFAYACSVMPGLARSSDGTLVEAMQQINVAILNPWFGSAFVGALLSTGTALVTHLAARSGRSAWLAAALVLYVAMLVVTATVNVPLNNALAGAGASATEADLAVARRRFERRWTRWNVARAVLSTAAFGCVTAALALAP